MKPDTINRRETSAVKQNSIWEGVTIYHWLVVVIASCGWLFDCMDQRLFTLARESALKELLGNNPAALADMKTYLGYATAAMMVGWATGGIVFGMMSDKLGRVKTMIATLLVYSGFTGLSALANSWVDFTAYRFLVGLGVGGMFGSATTLVAESVPTRFRSVALGSLQALSATGNIIGSVITLRVPPGYEGFVGGYSGWRALFVIGVLPALLVVPIVWVLKEPESWKKAKADAARENRTRNVGSPVEIFRDIRWRHNTLVGLFLGLSGMVGLWGIGFFSPELITTALKNSPFTAKDLIQPAAFSRTLLDAQNPAASYVRSRLTPGIIGQLTVIAITTNQVTEAQKTGTAAATSVVTEPQKLLADDLNRLIHGESLYDTTAFQSASLKKSTLDLLQQVTKKPVPADIAFLNRQLLEQLAPGTIGSLQSTIDKVRGQGLALQDVGSFLGMLVFTLVASYFNRRKAFLGAFLLCLLTTSFVFYSLKTANQAYWMLPMMGFAQLAVFAGYSIYFPELYPTRLRGTGVGFCYNTVRYLAAPFPILMGSLSSHIGFRNAAILMSLIYVVGAIALVWAPETKDQPLPEG